MTDWTSLIDRVNCMDAFDLLRMIPDGAVDLVLTDPPYGIGYDNEKCNRNSSNSFGKIEGDDKPLDFSLLLVRKEPMIVWGGEISTNNFRTVGGGFVGIREAGELQTLYGEANLNWRGPILKRDIIGCIAYCIMEL